MEHIAFLFFLFVKKRKTMCPMCLCVKNGVKTVSKTHELKCYFQSLLYRNFGFFV